MIDYGNYERRSKPTKGAKASSLDAGPAGAATDSGGAPAASRYAREKSARPTSLAVADPIEETEPAGDSAAFDGDPCKVACAMDEAVKDAMKAGGWRVIWSERARLVYRLTLRRDRDHVQEHVTITIDPELSREDFERELSRLK